MFFAAIFAYAMLTDIHTTQLSNMAVKNVQYNNAVDTAIDDALNSIVESADGNASIFSNLEGCVNTFYRSLYATFGALDNEVLQNDLQLYTPVLAIADVDGFYIIYNSVNDEGKLVKTWTPKMPYTMTFYEDVNGQPFTYTVNVNLGNDVVVTFPDDSNVYSGDYRELQTKYPGTKMETYWSRTVMSEDGTFNNWKTHYVTQMLCEQINYYAKSNNAIASSFGIKYNFSLPESAESDLANGINNVTFIALFQGYPYGVGTSDVFNKFCVSGAKVKKVRPYYVRPYNDGTGVHYYYHKNGCKELFDASVDPDGFYSTDAGLGYAFASDEEAAASGALPCPYCCY